MGQFEKYKSFILWHFFVGVAVILLGWWSCDKLVWKDLEPLFAILQNTSSMVFAIGGVWIAYLYPEAVASVIRGSDSFAEDESKEDIERIRVIVGVIALSAAVMMLLVLYASVVPLIHKATYYQSFRLFFKSIGIIFLYAIAYAQLFAVYVVLASNINFLVRLGNIAANRRMDVKLTRGKVNKISSNGIAGNDDN